jgi:hypothetical protein
MQMKHFSPGLSVKFIVHDNTEKNENIHTVWNRYIQQSEAKYWVNISPDVLPHQGWLHELLAVMEYNPSIAACGSSTDNTYNEQRGKTPIECARTPPLSYVPGVLPSGFCCAYRVEALKTLGGFREDFDFYGGDLDMCLRMKHAAWETAWAVRSYVSHIHGESAKELGHMQYSILRRKGDQQLMQARHSYSTTVPGYWVWNGSNVVFTELTVDTTSNQVNS